MMNDFDSFFNDDPWEGMQDSCYPEGRRLYLKDDRFWVSVDEQGRLLFFVHEEGVNTGKATNNFSSVNVEISKYGPSSSRLVCTLVDDNNDLREKFAIVAKNVAFSCSMYSGKQLFSKVLGRIKSWADFLKPKRSGLSPSEYLGFFGELYVLNKYVLPEFEPDDAVRFWIGQERKKQDFVFDSVALEVKSTMAGSTNTISISTLDQLDRITEHLYLLRLVFSPASENSGVSLEALYNDCMSVFELNLEAKTQFLLKTSKLYGEASDEQLSNPLFLANQEIYEVTDEFPCLTRSKVTEDIAEANYSIYASRISAFAIDSGVGELITGG